MLDAADGSHGWKRSLSDGPSGVTFSVWKQPSEFIRLCVRVRACVGMCHPLVGSSPRLLKAVRSSSRCGFVFCVIAWTRTWYPARTRWSGGSWAGPTMTRRGCAVCGPASAPGPPWTTRGATCRSAAHKTIQRVLMIWWYHTAPVLVHCVYCTLKISELSTRLKVYWLAFTELANKQGAGAQMRSNKNSIRPKFIFQQIPIETTNEITFTFQQYLCDALFILTKKHYERHPLRVEYFTACTF